MVHALGLNSAYKALNIGIVFLDKKIYLKKVVYSLVSGRIDATSFVLIVERFNREVQSC